MCTTIVQHFAPLVLVWGVLLDISPCLLGVFGGGLVGKLIGVVREVVCLVFPCLSAGRDFRSLK